MTDVADASVLDPSVDPRTRILRAADRLMYAKGYEAVGVAELCREAGVQKGSFYHFFASKQDLALEMLDRSWARTRRAIFASAFGDESRTALDAITRYGELLAEHLDTGRAEVGVVAGCRYGNFAVELSAHDDAIRAKIEAIFGEMTEVLVATIERGVAAGDVRADIDARQAAADVLAVMEGLMVMAKARQDPAPLQRLGALAALVLD
ncbi:MAG: TetR family transcriptional regulator [Actinomycetota bacterium]